MGQVSFDSPLLLAPMSAICNAPFRLLMEALGAGGTVSELISCHGINHGNARTLKMLELDPRERNIGLQLFGEDEKAMATAAERAEDFGPKFIDINMGCPVRKVVTKGGGSALLRDTQKLGRFFGTIKRSIDIPLTIKIRTGWDEESLNADEVIRIAHEEGVEFVAIHGRTRTQQYKGLARWDYLELLAETSELPIIGNGDLPTPELTKKRLKQTRCQGLMLGRGPLRNPFIFLDSFLKEGEPSPFTSIDYWEITQKLFELTEYYAFNEKALVIQMRKHIMWFAAGLPGAAQFRGVLFQHPTLKDTLKATEDFFTERAQEKKQLDVNEPFMTSGHG
jgi:nifR3 family TIM-barrel protein